MLDADSVITGEPDRMENMGIKDLVDRVNGESELGNFDRYSVEGLIGTGGAAKVYRAVRDGKAYAMKVPLSVNVSDSDTFPPKPDDDVMHSFMKEASNWAGLSDSVPDAAVCMKDYNITPFPWMVMELAERDLEDAMKDGSFTVDRFPALLRSLDSIHGAGVVHRDIKPGNILCIDGNWKFSDFGLSKTASNSRTTSVMSGTPVYMAPEQVSKRFGTTDARTDIWQMGIILYRLVVGRLPYGELDLAELSMAIIVDGPDISAAPEKYRPVLSKALCREMDGRYKSAAEFADDLESVLSGASEPPVQGTDPETVEHETVVPPEKDGPSDEVPPVRSSVKDGRNKGLIDALLVIAVVLICAGATVYILTEAEEIDFDEILDDRPDIPTVTDPAIGTAVSDGPVFVQVPHYPYLGMSGELP